MKLGNWIWQPCSRTWLTPRGVSFHVKHERPESLTAGNLVILYGQMNVTPCSTFCSQICKTVHEVSGFYSLGKRIKGPWCYFFSFINYTSHTHIVHYFTLLYLTVYQHMLWFHRLVLNACKGIWRAGDLLNVSP